MSEPETEGPEVVEKGVVKGYRWEVRLVQETHFCGYVRSNFRPPWTYSHFEGWPVSIIDTVHGGLTYGPDEDGWLGFDCAHAGDVCIMDGETLNDFAATRRKEWTTDDVAEECKSLAEQVAAVEEFVERFEDHGWGDA